MRHKTRIPSSMKNLRGLCGDPVKVEDRPACPACPLLLLLPRRLLPRLFCAHIREFINKSQIGFVTSPGLSECVSCSPPKKHKLVTDQIQIRS